MGKAAGQETFALGLRLMSDILCCAGTLVITRCARGIGIQFAQLTGYTLCMQYVRVVPKKRNFGGVEKRKHVIANLNFIIKMFTPVGLLFDIS